MIYNDFSLKSFSSIFKVFVLKEKFLMLFSSKEYFGFFKRSILHICFNEKSFIISSLCKWKIVFCWMACDYSENWHNQIKEICKTLISFDEKVWRYCVIESWLARVPQKNRNVSYFSSLVLTFFAYGMLEFRF